MKINQISNSLQRMAFVVMFMFSVFNPTFADSFSKYVGQSFILPIPKSPVSNGFVNSWSYSCSSMNISITNRGSSNPSEAVITKYFEGTLYIECYFQYIYYSNNRPITGTRTETHRVTCNSNNISISAPKSTLGVGEGMQMTYRFSTTTFDALPQITWKSSSSAVSINSNGYVVAKSQGTAKITATSNLGNNVAEYTINVQNINPTSISITTIQNSVYCDEGLQLSASVSPSTASQNVKWSMAVGNSSIATLSSTGYLYGISEGSVTVKATAENGISDTKTIYILEPAFTCNSYSPTDYAIGVSAFAKPSVSFSHDLYEGSNYSSIALKNASDGSIVDGTVSRSGKTLSISPTHALKPQTNYTLSIPANAVKNKWGTHYPYAIDVDFKTGDYERLTLKTSPSYQFLSKGDKITLTASKSSARIYYTLNGTIPTENSSLYSGAIVFENDIRLRAIAVGEGYENSEILSMDYYLTNVKEKRFYPNTDTQLFIYEDVNPSLTFSNKIEASDNINNVSVVKNGKDSVVGEVIVADSTIYFIPVEPLELGCYYKVSVPQNAIVTWQGEANAATSWTFCTGEFVTTIAMGNEISVAIKTDGSLLTWGDIYQSGNSSNGSYENVPRSTPETFVSSDVAFVSAGYMHNAIIKTDGSLWMWGRQYCGEFGNNSTTSYAEPTKIMDDVAKVSCGGQTTAILKKDGSLWMVGRNDFGQIGDSTVVVRKTPAKIMENVQSAAAGWCSSYAVTKEGKLFAWGRNDQGQLGDETTEDHLTPTCIMDGVAEVIASPSDADIAAAIKEDGSLWVWGKGNATPQKILDNVNCVSVGAGAIAVVKRDGSLWKSDGSSASQVAQGITNVGLNNDTAIALKNGGCVWTGSLEGFSNQIIEGMESSVLAGIKLNRKNIRMAADSRNVLVATPEAINADYASLEWTSANENVATVSERGVINAIAIGETDIRATILDMDGRRYSDTCHIQVVSASLPDIIEGDANGDGDVTISDVVTLVSALKGESPEDYDENGADADHDGAITIDDLQTIIRRILRK